MVRPIWLDQYGQANMVRPAMASLCMKLLYILTKVLEKVDSNSTLVVGVQKGF
jgi:hypothetical protein